MKALTVSLCIIFACSGCAARRTQFQEAMAPTRAQLLLLERRWISEGCAAGDSPEFREIPGQAYQISIGDKWVWSGRDLAAAKRLWKAARHVCSIAKGGRV